MLYLLNLSVSGRKDIKDEIQFMASALTKEMEMMEAQLNRSKESACEVVALREEADSLRTALDSKVLTYTCFHVLIVGEQNPDSNLNST